MKLTNTAALSAFAVVATTVGVYAATLSGIFDARVIISPAGSSQSGPVAVVPQESSDTGDAATEGSGYDTFASARALASFITNDPRDSDAEALADFFAGTTLGSVFGLDSVVGGRTPGEPPVKTTTPFEFADVDDNVFDTRITGNGGSLISDDGPALASLANPGNIRTTPQTGAIDFGNDEAQPDDTAGNAPSSPQPLVEQNAVSVVPLPASAFLLLGGLGAFGLLRRRKARS